MLLHLIKKPSYKKIPSIYYIDRKTALIRREKIPAEQWLKWLYHDPFGNLALEAVIKRNAFTRFYGRYMKTPRSSMKIKSFVNMFGIDNSEFEKELDDYTSFNDFFIRKIKKQQRPMNPDPLVVTSPVDGKLLAFADINKETHFIVKGHDFSLSEFLNNNRLAEEYYNGSMLIFRLTPADYHRFHFPFDCFPGRSHKIRGKYYSVSPISVSKKIKTYYQNKREFTILRSKSFGNVIMAEIGATLVGSIKQTFIPDAFYSKGEEKGYFEFGGSAVILLFKRDIINIDPDLINNTLLSYETRVLMGESVAVRT